MGDHSNKYKYKYKYCKIPGVEKRGLQKMLLAPKKIELLGGMPSVTTFPFLIIVIIEVIAEKYSCFNEADSCNRKTESVFRMLYEREEIRLFVTKTDFNRSFSWKPKWSYWRT